MSPVTGEKKKNGDKEGAPELHAKKGAHTSDAAGGEARKKIGAAPRNRRGDTEHYAAGHLLGLVLFYFEAEFGHNFLKIFPDFAFSGRITQQICGVIGGQHFVTTEVHPLSAEVRNASVGLQQRLRSGCAETNNHFRL